VTRLHSGPFGQFPPSNPVPRIRRWCSTHPQQRLPQPLVLRHFYVHRFCHRLFLWTMHSLWSGSAQPCNTRATGKTAGRYCWRC
jgi:hypothetical protein